MPEQTSADSKQESSKNAPPTISLPKGGGAIRGMGEKFAANPVTGTGSMSVPIATSPGRSGFGPQLSLSYDSGAGNGPFGLGWSLSVPQITRKTDKGLPQYRDAEESDVFILSGAEDLVPVLLPNNNRYEDTTTAPGYTIHRYRPRIEGLFARIERWTNQSTGEIHWRSISRDNITTLYGKDNNSRIFDSAELDQVDPTDLDKAHPTRIFSWLICQSYDDKGNAIVYEYQSEDSHRIFEDQHGQFMALAHERNRSEASRSANRYLKRIRYGNRQPNRDANSWKATDPVQLPRDTWMFEVAFDYDEGQYAEDAPDAQGRIFARAQIDPPVGSHWPVRQDSFSTYRAGFEVRTHRLCRRVLMFHHFPHELGIADCLVRSTEFTYRESPIASFVTSVIQSGYLRQPDAGHPHRYLKKSLPPVEFEYSQVPDSNQLAQLPIRKVEAESLENMPIGLDGAIYQWMDLDGEGTFGILTEQASGWFYKRNLSANHRVIENEREKTVAQFGPMEVVARKPVGGLADGAQFLDLAGDGQVDLVQMEGSVRGFYERTEDADWAPFQPFLAWPNINPNDPNLKFVDLNGDGHADILITEDRALTWYPSLAEEGFGPAERVAQLFDEEKGPRLVFNDGTQSIYLADLSGDGLSDLVRIGNGEVCYWPNLGYGRFGAKVTMDDSPRFDSLDLFDQRRIRLADTDGSGTTDILYLHRDGVQIYFNQSGNRWSGAVPLPQFPPIENISSVQALDLLGNGTACLVWSSPLPGSARRPMRYMALMEEKPHLLIGVKNNLGAETKVHYAPSTKFYLNDKRDGKPWITHLPFPVHVVERVETFDHISRNHFVTRYHYHHGYFDGVEREFRGFGMVEQWDTDEFNRLDQNAANVNASWHMPPVHTKTWFHTGAHFRDREISLHLACEYFGAPQDKVAFEAWAKDNLLDDTILPAVPLSADETRQACRALKGAMLRQEVYADDDSVKAGIPYTVTEQNFTIERLQPQAGNRHAVFFTHPREVISYHYERNLADPRISHSLVLHVDAFGNVLKAVAIGYGRRAGMSALLGDDKARQEQLLITYTENDYTENDMTDPAAWVDAHRTPLPCEARTYELTGFGLAIGAIRFAVDDFAKNGFSALTSLNNIPYETPIAPAVKGKRLIERVRTRYRRNDLAALLPTGTLQSLALPGESYKLAFTRGLLNVYAAKIATVDLQTILRDEGKYVELDNDGQWWIPSGRVFYSTDEVDVPAQELAEAKAHFFLPRRYRDPFGHDTRVDYDGPADPNLPRYDLLVTRTADALKNIARAENNYRVLQAWRMTDPNGNQSEAAFDTLGMVVATAIIGKNGEGDKLEDFNTDLTQAELDAFFVAPRPPNRALLGKASTRILYDVDRFRRTQQAHPADPAQWLPTYAAMLAREIHASDPNGATSKIQVSLSYSDGFGREIQKKMQAEKGPLQPGEAEIEPRWVGSGWTIFNNKGKPVRQYEPFFSTHHQFQFGKKAGVSPILFYDPAERVVATLHPNHTYEKVVFDPWQQTTWDVNDTVTLDPRADDDVRGLFLNADGTSRLPADEYLPTWYALRTDPAHAAEANQRWPDPKIRDAEKNAAEKAAVHEKTPAIAHFDALGRPFLTIADNGAQGKYETRVDLDIEGSQRAVVDAKNRVVMRYDYDMLGNRIKQSSMEAGARWMLANAAGKPIRAWDDRNFTRRMIYDELQRPTGLYVTEPAGKRLAEQTIYGEGKPSPEATNHRGKVWQVRDDAGIVTSNEYDFKGNLKSGKRDLRTEYKTPAHWAQQPAPATSETFTSRTTYDALNRVVEGVAPDGSVTRPRYNEANLLDAVEVRLPGAEQSTPFVTNINYDAKGQRELIEYGSGATQNRKGVTTTYTYDPLTFRLIRLTTTRPANPDAVASQLFKYETLVQDLCYTYDPAGNITRIEDAALKTIIHDGEHVEPVCEYTCDALYRLIEAKGREHIGQTAHDFNPPDGNRRDYPFLGLRAHPNDAQAMRNYTERYEYDAVGNFEIMRHIATGGSWTRGYEYTEASLLEPAAHKSNRLTRTKIGNDTETYTYKDALDNDAHGCLTAINSMKMRWDFEDQLTEVDLQGGGTACYVYDAAGQRVRKVIERNGATIEERIYLGGYEVYRKRQGDALQLERQTLHVMDDKQRIALVETRTQTQGNDPAPPQLIRYQFGNHLGSASLELDDQAQVISYEEYTPYGSTSYQAVRSQTETPKRYRYTGKERDEETGFSYHGARYYAPWLFRWISCDPAGMVDGTNLYEHVRGNPTRFFDTDGRSSLEQATNRAAAYVKDVIGIATEKSAIEKRVAAESDAFNSALSRYNASGKKDMAALTQMESATKSLEFQKKSLDQLNQRATKLNTGAYAKSARSNPPITRGEELASELHAELSVHQAETTVEAIGEAEKAIANLEKADPLLGKLVEDLPKVREAAAAAVKSAGDLSRITPMGPKGGGGAGGGGAAPPSGGAGETGAKAAATTETKAAVKELETGGKLVEKGAEKSLLKGAARFGMKVLPLIGIGAGAYFVREDLKGGNYGRAAVDAAEAIPAIGDVVLAGDIFVQGSMWGIKTWANFVADVTVSHNRQLRELEGQQ